MRYAEVPAGRFAGWVERFRDGNGGDVRLLADGSGEPVLHAADGTSALLDVAFDPGSGWGDLAMLMRHVARVSATQPYALLLLRRGGWAVAWCEGERVVDSSVGTRYVQGRTKKGGSSQHRFARRRDNQADSVVTAAVDAAADVWGAAGRRRPWTLVSGGDRLLLTDAVRRLEERVPLVVSTRRLEVPNPRQAVLGRAARSACAVRVRVRDAPALH